MTARRRTLLRCNIQAGNQTRAADTRAEAQAALEVVESLPTQIAATPAMAADRRG